MTIKAKQAMTSGTSVDFTIPAGATKIEIHFYGQTKLPTWISKRGRNEHKRHAENG